MAAQPSARVAADAPKESKDDKAAEEKSAEQPLPKVFVVLKQLFHGDHGVIGTDVSVSCCVSVDSCLSVCWRHAQIDAVYTSEVAAHRHCLLHTVVSAAHEGGGGRGDDSTPQSRVREVLGESVQLGSSDSNGESKLPPPDAKRDSRARGQGPTLTKAEIAAVRAAVMQMTDAAAMAAMSKAARDLITHSKFQFKYEVRDAVALL